MKDNVSVLFKTLADPTRREIFHTLLLDATPLPISKVSERFSMSRQGVSKHLAALEEAGLLLISKNGRQRLCQANAKPLRELNTWLATYDSFWNTKLTALENYLDKKE